MAIWSWPAGYTDGMVFGPFPTVGVNSPFCLHISLPLLIGVKNISILSQNQTTKAMSNITVPAIQGMQFDMCRISCKPFHRECVESFSNPALRNPVGTCGNGVVDPLEECDGGPCCTDTCTLQPSGLICSKSYNACVSASYCNGSSGYCPPNGIAPICNCSGPYYGVNCTLGKM